ncbi:MAG: uroporphyrinogen synthase [Steroidobacteraceae bacterium]|nr:uroporphyrinogen synthase [Steroidobacteraceae bacterium]
MSASLEGRTIVVTRPAAQSGRFIELATQAGARCIAFPTLEVERLPLSEDTLGDAQRADWDWAIYTSTNAVEAAFDALGRAPAARRAAAVGRATARALEQRGVGVSLRPETANSEGLLAAPELQTVTNARVLLVKGAGGRDLLRATLTARGARVFILEVYRRALAQPTDEARSTLHATLVHDLHVVVAVTSADVLAALLQLVGADDAALLRTRTLLAPGARVVATARELGWTGPIVQAATAEDDAMLRALQDVSAGTAPPA